MSELKIKAAKAALSFIEDDMIVGIGSGSTVSYFITELATIKHRIDACVASSKETEGLLRAKGIPVIDLNSVQDLPIYIDSADEITSHGEMIKGGGGAHTREKIIANVAKHFICIIDDSKLVNHLGEFPIAVEVLPLARSFVARRLVQLGGDPQYREGFVTDNGNIIIDVFNLIINTPIALENNINSIPGVVDNGLFANRLANTVLMASSEKVERIHLNN
ncbi:MAG: ribose-5-phosphate isomerase RpiA [Legionella sp.]|nr:ribose-5-phosphate isomerase RpiA [Legionella sp.]